MAAPRFVAVIDIGKTNAKLAIFDLATQREIDRLTTPNTVVNAGLYPHYDVERLWHFICASLRELGARHAIHAISVTTHGASAALLLADGTLAMPVLDYEYNGPESVAAAYQALRPQFAETGSPLLPVGLNLAAQIFWQQREFAQAFAEVRWIVTYPQYWAYRLSGVLANELTSLGCHTDLWAVHANDYSSLVQKLGWAALMPSLRKASDILAPLHAGLASELGLPQGIPVHCGIHDSNASLLPHVLGRQKPFAVVSTGTWVVCMAMDPAPRQLDPARDTLVNVNALGAPVPSARFMGGREFEQLGLGRPIEVSLQDEAQVLSESVMLLPSVVQGSGPFAAQKAEWLNATLANEGQRKVAASFYLALMTATCLELIGARGDVIVEGPFANNAQVMAMLAAATGRPVQGLAASTGTTAGAALLCSRGEPPSPAQGISATSDARHKAYAAAWQSQQQRRGTGF
jgi:sugar (pentulose or hexulose) kinase